MSEGIQPLGGVLNLARAMVAQDGHGAATVANGHFLPSDQNAVGLVHLIVGYPAFGRCTASDALGRPVAFLKAGVNMSIDHL